MIIMFHRRDVIMTIIFSLISVTVITAPGGNQGAGPSGSQTPEYVSASESPEYLTASDEESSENYKGSTLCWWNMRRLVGMEKPKAIDFVKKAIRKWTKYFFTRDYEDIQFYYNTIYAYFVTDKISHPKDFCRENGDNDANIDDHINRTTPCERNVSIFGETNNDALMHAFYLTDDKQVKYGRDIFRRRIFIDGVEVIILSYRELYFYHILENVRLNGKEQSPFKYCREHDMMYDIEKKHNEVAKRLKNFV